MRLVSADSPVHFTVPPIGGATGKSAEFGFADAHFAF